MYSLASHVVDSLHALLIMIYSGCGFLACVVVNKHPPGLSALRPVQQFRDPARTVSGAL